MSNSFQQMPDTIIATIGFNDGANKGFWRIQPRDDEGQWIEMGADVLFRFRTGDGNLVVGTVRGIYVGPGGRPGRARVMVEEGNEFGLEPGVYDVESRNLQQFKAILPEGDGDGSGAGARKDKFGRPVQTLADGQLPALSDLLQNRQPITDEDRRLGRGELTTEEREAEADGREKSPIANLPAGFESENPEEVKKLLRESGVDPDEFSSPKSQRKATDYMGRTPQDVIDGNPPPMGYTNDEFSPEVPGGIIPRDGSGRVPFSVRQENARKAKDRALLEKQLGRKLTEDEAGALDLRLENTNPVTFGTTETFTLYDPNDKEMVKRLNAAVAKRHALRKAVTSELEGKKLDAKDAAADAKARELFQDAYEGKAPDIDDAVSGSIALEKELGRKTEDKSPFDLEPGDIVIGDDGQDYVVLGLSGATATSITLRLQGPDGVTRTKTVPTDVPIATVSKTPEARPPRPARPARPKPAVPPKDEKSDEPEKTTPEAPPAPPTPPVPPKDDEPFNEPDDLPNGFPPSDKIDNGDPIVLEPLTEEGRAKAIRKKIAAFINKATGGIFQYFDDNGKKRPASDPFELLDALAEAYPNAKFTKDGTALILDRRTDKDGRTFELLASNSGSKAVVYTMRWTNPETGEVEELIHIDKRHSITSLFRKDNGPDGLMARLLSDEELKHGNKRPIPADASLRERAEWFVMKQKLFTAGNLAKFYGNGRKAIFHTDGTLKNQEVPGIMDAYMDFIANPNADTREALYERLMGVFGRIPMNAASHREARAALRAEFKRLYPEVNMRQMGAYITNASRAARGLAYDADPDVRATPFASKDRVTPIEPGMTVEYVNNVGDKSVLKVIGFAPTVGVVSGNEGDEYDYDDYIYVRDSNGKTYRINAIKAKILKNQEEALSDYKPNLQLEELRKRRAALGLYGVAGESIPAKVPGTTSISKDAPPPLPDIVDDLIEGDILPNFKEGGDVGEIIKTRFVTTKSGEQAIAFTVVTPEGEEMVVVHRLGKEIPKKA